MTNQPDEEPEFKIVSVMLDAANYSARRSALEKTILGNAPLYGSWVENPHKTLATVIAWQDDKIALHISFNGGNVRRSFWQECVYPRAERYIGSIFLLNASKPESFNVARYLLREYQKQPIDSNLFSVPPIIALTNYNDPLAWDAPDIALCLRDVLTDNLFLHVDPTDWHSVKELLITSCAYFAEFL